MARRTLVDLGFADKDVSLTSIAAELGISVSTVSRAMRNRPGIHPLTRERILERAEALGYARKPGQDAEVAPINVLVLSQVSGSGIDDGFLAGISHLAASSHANMFYQHFRSEDCESVVDPARQPAAMKSGSVDGIILTHRWPEDVVRRLAAERPVISIVHAYPGIGLDVVTIDDRRGTELLIQHLRECGHTRTAFFGLCPEITWSRSRFGSYVEELVLQELPLDLERVVRVSTEDALDEGVHVLEHHKKQVMGLIQKGVTAFACASDVLGYSLLQSLAAWGVRVPEDIAVTGFHSDLRGVLAGLPLLTSTQLPNQELGATALRRLLNRLQHPDEMHRSIIMPCTLLVGKTTLR